MFESHFSPPCLTLFLTTNWRTCVLSASVHTHTGHLQEPLSRGFDVCQWGSKMPADPDSGRCTLSFIPREREIWPTQPAERPTVPPNTLQQDNGCLTPCHRWAWSFVLAIIHQKGYVYSWKLLVGQRLWSLKSFSLHVLYIAGNKLCLPCFLILGKLVMKRLNNRCGSCLHVK